MNFILQIFIKDYKNTSDNKVREQYGKFAGSVGILFNLLLFALKLVIGALSGSIAIFADAFNNLTDASAGVITLVGFKLSNKPADKDHPYGHARYEYIAALGVATMTMVVGVELLLGSFREIINPKLVQVHTLTIIILTVSIIIKFLLFMFNKHLGNKINSKVLKATALDSRNDMITTTIVLIGIILGSKFNLYLDGYLGLLVALFILISGVTLVSEILSLLLGERPDPELVIMINHKISTYDSVLGSHDLIVHDYGPGHRFASVHVEMDADMPALDCHEVIDTIERDFKEEHGLEIVIHYDPIVTSEGEYNDLRMYLSCIIESISPKLNFHDFRYVPSHGHTNLIFDLVVPYEFEHDVDRIKKEIEAGFNKGEKRYYTVITIDFDYSER